MHIFLLLVRTEMKKSYVHWLLPDVYHMLVQSYPDICWHKIPHGQTICIDKSSYTSESGTWRKSAEFYPSPNAKNTTKMKAVLEYKTVQPDSTGIFSSEQRTKT